MFSDLPTIIRFHDPLRAVIQTSVADGNSQSSCLQILAMHSTDAVHNASNPGAVLRPFSRSLFRPMPPRRGAVHIGKFVGLRSPAMASAEIVSRMLAHG